jgi:acyl-CoA synthetase (AMP-forming)/AMP-acid ligase II
MSGKKVGSGTITANFHRAELRKLPGVEVGRANKRYMHAHVTVHAGAIEANIQAKRDTSPRRVAGLAIKAHLEAWLAIFHTAAVYTPCFPYQL